MMKRSFRRLLLLSGVASLALTGASIVQATPASARVCVWVTIYTEGVAGPPWGFCEPLLDEWLAQCAGAAVVPVGHGVGVDVCFPTPV